MKLSPQSIVKPWGRDVLPPPFMALGCGANQAEPIGEIWFEAAGDAFQKLKVKYIFTREKLSVQVHPNDDQAQARGLVQGKSECWYILAAEAGARIGLGTQSALTPEALKRAALDGSIEQLMDWKAVKAGDFFFVPAGTLHVIGAGVSLVEIQQNCDVTYRLYDYGRKRDLHLDEALAVAQARPYPMALAQHVDISAHRADHLILAQCSQFTIVHSGQLKDVRGAYPDKQMWVVPLTGVAMSGSDQAEAGDCLWLGAGEELQGSTGATALIGLAQ